MLINAGIPSEDLERLSLSEGETSFDTTKEFLFDATKGTYLLLQSEEDLTSKFALLARVSAIEEIGPGTRRIHLEAKRKFYSDVPYSGDAFEVLELLPNLLK